MARKYSKASGSKVKRAMHEMKQGTLRSGRSGAKVKSRKQALATKISNALKVHTEIEEEIFYPAFLASTKDADMHHEAVVEHAEAKKLIAEIEASSPQDDYFDAKVKVLSEMIKHHVKEEEQPGGMFARARKSDMNMEQLGQELKARKTQLEAQQAHGAH